LDAIILVGGQGTRLRPLTDGRHKSLVPVCNRPAIEYLLEWVARSGFDRAILSLGQHNEDLADAYPDGAHCGVQTAIVQEHERLESGGAIRYAVEQARVDGRFAVLNGDVYVDFDFKKALAAHSDALAELTMALYDVEDPSAFGVAVTDGDGLITRFVEKPARGTAPSHAINAGVWIFERGLVDEIPAGAVRVEETLFPSLVEHGRRVLGYRFDGPWEDIGTPARYLGLNLTLLDKGVGGLADDASVAPSAVISRSVVGARTSIRDGAAMRDSVTWEDVAIEAGARVERSVIADHVIVGEGASVTGAVIGRGAWIAPGAHVPDGASVAAETRYHGADER
jgi:mannose-1-phosphate guanylyltransferase